MPQDAKDERNQIKIIIGNKIHLFPCKKESNYIKYKQKKKVMIVRSEQGSSTYHDKGKEILGKSKHIHEGHNIKLRRINNKMKKRQK